MNPADMLHAAGVDTADPEVQRAIRAASDIHEQRPPTPNESRPVWELVVEDMLARDQLGRERYGTPLQAFNGRRPLVDVYQELLDAVVYTKQELLERAGIVAQLDNLHADLAATIRQRDEASRRAEFLNRLLNEALTKTEAGTLGALGEIADLLVGGLPPALRKKVLVPEEPLDPDGWVHGTGLSDAEQASCCGELFATREEARAAAVECCGYEDGSRFHTARKTWERFVPPNPFSASGAADNPPDDLGETAQENYCDAVAAHEKRLDEMLESTWAAFVAETGLSTPVFWYRDEETHVVPTPDEAAAK